MSLKSSQWAEDTSLLSFKIGVSMNIVLSVSLLLFLHFSWFCGPAAWGYFADKPLTFL